MKRRQFFHSVGAFVAGCYLGLHVTRPKFNVVATETYRVASGYNIQVIKADMTANRLMIRYRGSDGNEFEDRIEFAKPFPTQ